MRKMLFGLTVAALLALLVVPQVLAGAGEYKATLDGASEVPGPGAAVAATGRAEFQVSPDGSAVSFRVRFQGLSNVTGAHIHYGSMGAAGPIVVDLLGIARSTGRYETDKQVEGVIHAADVITPAGWTQPYTWQAFLADVQSGAVYTNVHTTDFAKGAIRGQLGGNAGDDNGGDHHGGRGGGDDDNGGDHHGGRSGDDN